VIVNTWVSWGKVVRIQPFVEVVVEVAVAVAADEGSGKTSIQQEGQWALS
jgi:hypothetical protein